MQIILLKSKILRAEVTGAHLDYEGSLGLDRELMDRVGIVPYEKLLVGNLNNGARFETYAIAQPEGSKAVVLNGAAARLGIAGDLLVIMSFTSITEEEAENWKPKTIVLSERNENIVRTINC